MRRECPDCGVKLVWVVLVDRTEFGPRTGLQFKTVLEGQTNQEVDGEIHGGVCPACSRVLLYAHGYDSWAQQQATAKGLKAIEAALRGEEVDVVALERVLLERASTDVVRTKALEELYSRVSPPDFEALVGKALAVAPPGGRLYESVSRALLERPSRTAVEQMVRVGPYLAGDVRLRLLSLLEWAGTAEARAALRRWLHDPDSRVAVASIEALVRMGARDTAVQLQQCLGDGRSEVVAAALRGLGQIGGPQYIPAIEKSAAGVFQARVVKKAAEEAIASISARKAVGGALTLSGPAEESGSLSVVEGEEGGLSVLDDPAALSTPET